MKRLIISISVIFFLASFSLVPAYAQLPNLSLYQAVDKKQYRLRLEEGKQYYMQTINEQQISDPTPAQEGTGVMTIGTGAEFDVGDIDSNGNAQVTYTYRWVKIGLKWPADEKVYDSSKKDSTVPPGMEGFAALLEESFSLKITPKGRVEEIKGLDKMRSNVRKKLPAGQMQGFIINSLNQWLDEEAVKERIENSMAIYPDEPVGIGDSWSRNVAISREFAMILENKWTLKARKNGVAVIEVVSTIKPNPEAKPKEVGVATMSYEFSGKQQGLIEMQESTGLIIHSKINQQMSGQSIMTSPGAPDKVAPMEIKSVVTMETSDWNKAKSIVGTNAVAERPSDRERSFARTESPRRRAITDAISPAQPYLSDDDEEYMPARPRPNKQERAKTLHEAARDGDIDQVQLLISKGADVNEKSRMGWTPLHTAIQNRKQEVIEPLIAKGADVNAKDNRGQTPLMAAIYVGQKNTVELLLAKGADVNVMGRSDNALSLAKKRRNTEIVNLLLKHGAEEPNLQDLLGDRYYGEQGGASPYSDYEDYGARGTIQRGTRTISPIVQSPVQVDILADPNEIRARVKTFEGLQKALEEVDGKSQNETRQWQQKRYDNRTLLIRAVQKQFEDEIGVIRKVAVEEKAKKTTETIDSLLTGKQERFKKVSKELLAQKRELRLMQPSRGRGRARTSGRSTRGRSSQRGQPYGEDMTDPLYGRGNVMPRTNRYQSARGPAEQIDREAENEIRQWLQATDKDNLAQAVHEQIRVEISSIRIDAVKEEAKKTTAAIDGVLLYRQMRFEEFIRKVEEEKQALLQTQDPRIRGRGRYPQDGQMQQQNQPRTRGRRR